MRPLRSPSFLRLSPLAFALLACSGNQQGYYGPCDEPAGLGVGCPADGNDPFDDDGIENAWDACMKLATCGVIHTDLEDENDAADFDGCIAQIQSALGQDQGATILLCIEEASCPDLANTTDDNGNAMGGAEAIIGWCGRLDPT